MVAEERDSPESEREAARFLYRLAKKINEDPEYSEEAETCEASGTYRPFQLNWLGKYEATITHYAACSNLSELDEVNMLDAYFALSTLVPVELCRLKKPSPQEMHLRRFIAAGHLEPTQVMEKDLVLQYPLTAKMSWTGYRHLVEAMLKARASAMDIKRTLGYMMIAHEYELAEALLRACVDHCPESPANQIILIRNFMRWGRQDLALKAYREFKSLSQYRWMSPLDLDMSQWSDLPDVRKCLEEYRISQRAVRAYMAFERFSSRVLMQLYFYREIRKWDAKFLSEFKKLLNASKHFRPRSKNHSLQLQEWDGEQWRTL